MLRGILVSLSLLLVGSGLGKARADLLFSATGYPDLSHTNGHPEMGAVDLPSNQMYFVSGQRVSLQSDAIITGVAGVGSVTTTAWGEYSPFLNIFEASGVDSREQVFADEPLMGNAYHGSLMFSGTPVPFGVGYSGFPNYYSEFGFVPFTLEAGEYIFSVTMTTVGQSWGWAESDFDSDGAIFTQNSSPGAYVEYEGNAPFLTGTMGIDIEGTYVPEPSGVALLVMMSLVGFGRRRRA